MLYLHIEQPATAGTQAVQGRSFDARGGTIGRGTDCDLVLLDNDKRISRLAAEVCTVDGHYCLRGRSSAHPVTVNGADLAAGQERRLNDGDRIGIGHYRLRVERSSTQKMVVSWQTTESAGHAPPIGGTTEIEAAAHDHPPDQHPLNDPSLHDGVRNHGARHNDAQDDPVSEQSIDAITDQALRAHRMDFAAPPKTRPTMLLEHLNQAALQALRAAGEVQRDALAAASSAASSSASSSASSVTSAATSPAASSASSSTNSTVISSAALLAAFLDGAGLEALPGAGRRGGVEANLDTATMRRIGELLRAFVEGSRRLLGEVAADPLAAGTAAAESIDGAANPLRLAPTDALALAQLLAARPPQGLLGGEACVHASYRDLRAHGAAAQAGTRAMLEALSERMSPQVIEERLAPRGIIDRMLQNQRKARLWERFVELSDELRSESLQAGERAYSAAFEKAYQTRRNTSAADRQP